MTAVRIICERVRAWNKEREITEFGQRKNLVANLLEELTEFKRAKDENEKIDALCDIAVFSLGLTPVDIDYMDFSELLPTRTSKDFAEMIGTFDKTDCLAIVIDIVKLAYKEICKRGYNPILAMDETLKEIESRTGAYCLAKGKFVKDKGAYNRKEAMDIAGNFKEFKEDDKAWYFDGKRIVKWYRANYAVCICEVEEVQNG